MVVQGKRTVLKQIIVLLVLNVYNIYLYNNEDNVISFYIKIHSVYFLITLQIMVITQTQISSLSQKSYLTYCSLIEGVWILFLQPSIFCFILLYHIKTVRFFLVQICPLYKGDPTGKNIT